MKDKRVVFMGTPDFSVPVLEKLIENTNVVLVVTKKDAYVGRKKVLTESPVAICAHEHNIEVYKPNKLKEDYEYILNKKPDIIITCAYGSIVPKVVLDYPSYGCINVHASLLPKYRGASPIVASILNGEKETGITIMYMDEGIDTGNIIMSRSIKIEDNDNSLSLSNKLSLLGANLLIDTLPKIFEGENFDIPQDNEEATYVGMLKREDEHIDFNNSVENIKNQVRAFSPEPYTFINIDDTEYKISEVEIKKCDVSKIGIIVEVNKDSFGITAKDGIVYIKRIKPSGKKEMSVKDFFNGFDKKSLLNKKVD
ncbi:methionyl-tRNA formyltransferase [Firmicutes bacterium CAG:582]|nr:methionyl-tRNA formyltransferase [Firmicutes bacterium CAG:582]